MEEIVLEPGARVTVAVPDMTRPIEWEKTLEPLLKHLSALEVEATVVVALGLHRRMTEEELEPIVSRTATYGIEVVQHDPEPDTFHRRYRDVDALICVGVVEPHQYAGYSGGVKTVAIGCAPRRIITKMHGMTYLRDDRVALGSFDENPFQNALWETAATLAPAFGVYAVPRPSRPTAVIAGPAREAMERAVGLAAQHHFREVDEPVDWLHLQVPPSKAQNLYQASRAATYAGLVDRPAVREGGLLIVEASAPEGLGEGPGERACAEAMSRGRSSLLAELRSNAPVATKGGAQRAYVIAKTLERYAIVFVGTTCGEVPELEAMGIGRFPDADAARRAYGVERSGLVVADPFHQVPRLVGPVEET